MPSRTPGEALESHRQSIQRLVSCISNHVIGVNYPRAYFPSLPDSVSSFAIFELGNGLGVPLRSEASIAVRVQLTAEIVQDLEIPGSRSWMVRTGGYLISFSVDGRELVAYQWHPHGRSPVTDPHLHIGPAIAGSSMQIGTRTVNRVHFPTGVVTLASMVRLAIEEFGVEPLRTDWQAVLDDETVV